jgi:hypothetical protein
VLQIGISIGTSISGFIIIIVLSLYFLDAPRDEAGVLPHGACAQPPAHERADRRSRNRSAAISAEW